MSEYQEKLDVWSNYAGEARRSPIDDEKEEHSKETVQ